MSRLNAEDRFFQSLRPRRGPPPAPTEDHIYVLDALSGWATVARVLDLPQALQRIERSGIAADQAQQDALLSIELARSASGTFEEEPRMKHALSRVLTAAVLDPKVAARLKDDTDGPRHLFFVAYTMSDGHSTCSAALEVGSPGRALTPDEQGLVFVRMLVQDMDPRTDSLAAALFLWHGRPLLHRTLDDVVHEVMAQDAF